MGAAIVSFDGASRGNPGPMAGGAVVEFAGKQTICRGPISHGTNNEAEYLGLILGVKAAMAAGAKEIILKGDSQLVIRQLEGRYQVKARNLKPLYGEAMQLLAQFDSVKFDWVRRMQNVAADQAANEALDL